MNIEMKNVQLAEIIREEREKRNLTQEHLAQLAEVSPRTIQRLEADGSHSKETLMAVAEAFGMDSRELLKLAQERADKGKKAAENPFIVIRLVRRRTGKALLHEIANGDGMIPDYPGKMTSAQTEVTGWLLDFMRDFADIHNDIEPSDELRYEQMVSEKLEELEKLGLSVFTGACLSKQNYDNGKTLTLRVNVVLMAPANDARIVRMSGCEEFINGVMPRGAVGQMR